MSSPDMRRPPMGGGADATSDDLAPESYSSHATYMRQTADRIHWLHRHRHWWLRAEAGRHQREYLDRRWAA
jgi:hypothetical protein